MRESQLLYRKILASSLTFYSGRLNRGAQGGPGRLYLQLKGKGGAIALLNCK